MSLSFNPLIPVCMLDPMMDLNQNKSYGVSKAGSQTTYKAYTTTSISASSLQFSTPPPSSSIVMSRKALIYCPVRLTYTGIPPLGQTLLQPNRDAPRFMPISQSIDTLAVTINNQSVSINLAEIINPLMHYNTDTDLKAVDYSGSPAYQDQFQNYSDGFLSIRNALANYSDSVDGAQLQRGAFPFTIIANPVSNGVDAVTAIVDVAFAEYIFLSPFSWGKNNQMGFYNITTLDWNFTFLSQAANRMWSHDDQNGTNVITSSTMAFGGVIGGPASSSFPQNQGAQPYILLQFVTPQETQIIPANMPLTYSYYDVLRFPTDVAAAVAGSTNTYNSNNIQLSSIPRRLYIYVRERNSDLYSNASKTDTFFQINQISLQFLNKNGLLASASMNQIYNICVKNGCKLSWNQWQGSNLLSQPSGATFVKVGGVGAVVCLEFAQDIGLDSLMCPGILTQSQLQVTVTCTNISGRTINPTLYLVPILEGTFTIISAGNASLNVGVLSQQDVLDCHQAPHIGYGEAFDAAGGDFFSGLKDFGTKLWSYLKPAHDFVKKHQLLSKGLQFVPEVGPALSTVAKTFGYGEQEAGLQGQGGRMLPRSKLHERIRRH